MADTLQIILSFPPENASRLSPKTYNTKITAYNKELQKIPAATWTKPIDKKDILDILNPAINTIPYMVALRNHINAAGKDKSRHAGLIPRSILFFASFDPIQVRYAGELWGLLLSWFFEILPAEYPVDLRPITTAMLRLDPTGGTFTTFHLRLVRLCLDASVPSQALPVLDKNIYAYPQKPLKEAADDLHCEESELSNWFITPKSGFTNGVSVEQILEYYLLGAQVYIGQRKWNRARLFLEHVILTPSSHHVASGLQVEAYKKWLLVGLLETGKSYPYPKTADGLVMKYIKAIAKPYEALVDDFEKRDIRKYVAETDVGTQVWFEDGNLSLVREVGDALQRYRIIDLQKTYAALPVSRVASLLGLSPKQTLDMITSMIEQRYLNGVIIPNKAGSTDPVLKFNTDTPSTQVGEINDEELQAQTKRIEDLVMFIRDADHRLQLTKEYIDYQKRMKRVNAGPDGDLADQMDLTWDAPSGPLMEDGDEEDIMAI